MSNAYFSWVALVHLAALATRLDVVGTHVPVGVRDGLFWLTFPLLFVSGVLLSMLPELDDHLRVKNIGDDENRFATWMALKSKPAKVALTLALMFLTVCIVQRFDIKIGPLDPSPPTGIKFDAAKRTRFFLMMCGVSIFPAYLLATKLLVPPLLVVGRLARKLSAPGGAAVLALAGLVVGGLAVQLFASKGAVDLAKAGKIFLQQPILSLGLALGGAFLPVIFAPLIERASDRLKAGLQGDES